jgi:hypothetical protein
MGAMKYDAFISYSHAADGALAPALQRGLHRLAKPWYALRVYRDETNLAADPGMWTDRSSLVRVALPGPDGLTRSGPLQVGGERARLVAGASRGREPADRAERGRGLE